jgi:hypothetical protein
MRYRDLGVSDYPTTDVAHEDVFSGRTGTHSMSVFSLINTMGKSNPGDRVDIDVSGLEGELVRERCVHRFGSRSPALREGRAPDQCCAQATRTTKRHPSSVC